MADRATARHRWKPGSLTAMLAIALAGGLWIAERTSSYPASPQAVAPYAASTAPAKYATAANQARLLAQEWLVQRGYPGLSVAVGVNGEIVWSEGFGYADLADRGSPGPTLRRGQAGSRCTGAALRAQFSTEGVPDYVEAIGRSPGGYPTLQGH